MTGSGRDRRAALVAPALAAALLVLVWAAATGPGQLLTPSPRARAIPTELTAVATPSGSETARSGEELTKDVEQKIDLSWLGDLIVWAIVLGGGLLLLLGVIALVRHGLRNRWLRPGRRTTVEFEVLPEERAVQALVDDAAERLAAVEHGNVRNGIVRCWARLEDSVAEAGLPRARYETSAEFTVRVLHALDLDPHAIGELARLYREARFSEHDLDEGKRGEARAALLRLEQDLGVLL